MNDALRYEAAVTKNFIKELSKLPKDIRNRILKAIDEILANPLAGIKLRGELEGYWRWRVGKYRIVYKINETQGVVVFLDVGHRKLIYE
ncbi:MAG: type II toxin-antitoxin system RelE/ParE family toxin [Candidatus Methanomethyliaceae archaeon]